MVFLPVVIYSLDETRFLGVKGERERERNRESGLVFDLRILL